MVSEFPGQELRCLILEQGSCPCALPSDSVRQVLAAEEWHEPSPLCLESIGFPRMTDAGRTRVLVVQGDGGSVPLRLHGSIVPRSFAVSDVLELPARPFSASLFCALLMSEERVCALLLDPERLLDAKAKASVSFPEFTQEISSPI